MATKALLTALLFSLLIPLMGTAKEMSGRLGIGYYHSEAPIGLRYWFAPKLALDLGFGFESEDLGSRRANSFWLEGGVPFVLHESKRANFFLRAGGLLGRLGDGFETHTTLEILGGPGVEVFFGDNLSLEVAQGFSVEIISLSEDFDESLVNFRTTSGNLTRLGFHYYFE
jgi:hypothetical protein